MRQWSRRGAQGQAARPPREKTGADRLRRAGYAPAGSSGRNDLSLHHPPQHHHDLRPGADARTGGAGLPLGESSHSYAWPARQSRRIGAHCGNRPLHHRLARQKGQPLQGYRHETGRRSPRQGALLPIQHRRRGRDHRRNQHRVGEKKKMIRKATRVPIPLMASIQRGDLRGTNQYEVGPRAPGRSPKWKDATCRHTIRSASMTRNRSKPT